MPETDPGSLPTSKMELAVTIMAPPYMPSLLLDMRLSDLSSITYIIVIL